MKYLVVLLLALSSTTFAQTPGYFGDQRDGTYINPILPGDFQNTDVVRSGNDYYYISATKSLSPGMLVLRSEDLVSWQPLGHVVRDITVLSPRYSYDRMDGEQRGIWAGAIARQGDLFYVYFTTPDEGVYVSTSKNPGGPWGPLTCLIQEPGWDDPCPFWDDDGQPYLVITRFAKDPKTGTPYNIHLFKMNSAGTSLLRDTDTIIHQSRGSEASKLFKRNGWYYHFYSEVTNEGRVPMMHRARSIAGPYETRQVNHVNKDIDAEPNQGTILQTPAGEWFFITHHGSSDWTGRPASLLPVTWVDDWPVAGTIGPDGVGKMVWTGKMPAAAATQPSSAPKMPFRTDDNFDGPILSPQWEWYFQPRMDHWSLSERPGYLRLRAFKPLVGDNLLKIGNVLTQRPLRAANNAATVKMDIQNLVNGQTAGLGFLGRKYAGIGVRQVGGVKSIVFNNSGKISQGPPVAADAIHLWFKTAWAPTGEATFHFSADGVSYTDFGDHFQITNLGNFLGAKLGIYTVNDDSNDGYVDVDSFRYSFSQRP